MSNEHVNQIIDGCKEIIEGCKGATDDVLVTLSTSLQSALDEYKEANNDAGTEEGGGETGC